MVRIRQPKIKLLKLESKALKISDFLLEYIIIFFCDTTIKKQRANSE